jgi:hypothetical protein
MQNKVEEIIQKYMAIGQLPFSFLILTIHKDMEELCDSINRLEVLLHLYINSTSHDMYANSMACIQELNEKVVTPYLTEQKAYKEIMELLNDE